MSRKLLLCLTVCVALEAQPHLPKRGVPSGSLSAAQQRNVEKLKGDLESIKGKSQITPQMKQQLATDPSLTQKLVDDLTAASADKNLSSREIAQLTNDF